MIKDFDLFKRTFTKYQEGFGLLGYTVYLKYEPIESGEFANITVSQDEMVATVRLNSKLGKEDKQFKHVELSAKHEATHLLLNRLEYLARCRYYIGSDDISEECESLVNKLCRLIP